MSLLALPNELLVPIFLHIHPSRCLVSLSLVNKRLNQIVRPLLVRQLSSELDRHDGLAVHLLRNPLLRSQIRHLHFEALASYDEDDDDTTSPPVVGLKDLSTVACPLDSSSQSVPNWSEQVSHANGLWDAIPTLILSWAVNLTHLSVSVPWFNRHDPWSKPEELLFLRYVFETTRRISAGVPTPLPLMHLESVNLRWWDSENGLYYAYAAPFFHLPNLRRFSSHRLQFQRYEQHDSVSLDNSAYQMGFPKSKSPVKTIILEAMDLNAASLKEILGACKALESLTLELAEVRDNQDLSSNGVADAILEHARSLKELIFSPELDPGLFGQDSSDYPFPMEECYRQLKLLETLTIPFYELLDDEGKFVIDRLPRSLRYLQLREIVTPSRFWSDISNIESLIGACGPGGLLPDLKVLKIPRLRTPWHPTEEGRKNLESQAVRFLPQLEQRGNAVGVSVRQW